MTRAREWQVSLDFKARLDEDAAFDLMEVLGRYGASVAVDPGHTGGGLTPRRRCPGRGDGAG